MGMDLHDQRYFDGKFAEVRKMVEHHTELLHKRISDHEDKDEISFKEISKDFTSAVKDHENTFHSIGAGKLVAYIGGILGIVAAIIALVKLI